MLNRILSVLAAFAVVTTSSASSGASGDQLTPRHREKESGAGFDALRLRRIDDAMRAAIARGQVNGVVTLLMRHGRVIRFNAYGDDDPTTGKPLSKDAIFRIFSMTKPVTAVAMMILYDEGKWRPSDPIAMHLPELANLKVATGFAADGTPILAVPRRQPTVGDVMTHSAGFAYGLSRTTPIDRLYADARLFDVPNRATFLHRLSNLPLAYEPGTAWQYSVGMDIEAAMIERLSGQSLPVFMENRIFRPLGMVDTGFFVPPEKMSRLATLYAPAPSTGRLTPFVGAPLGLDATRPPAVANGGGGLVSTARDYGRFAQMLLDGGQLSAVRIISPAAARLMMANHLPDSFAGNGYGIGNFAYVPGTGFAWNGGTYTDPALAGQIVGKGTYFWDGAAGTWFWIDPVNDIVFVGMIQRLGGPGGPALQEVTRPLVYQALRPR